MLIYNPQEKISAHFKMYEIAKSSTASRLMIDNTPTTPVLESAKLLAEHILEPIRVHFGVSFSPNSWYRGEELEKTITRKSFEAWCTRKGMLVNDESWQEYFSRKSHPLGEAADIEIPGLPNDELFVWIQSNIPEFDQLIREFPKPGDPYSGWVHVSYREGNNRNQVFQIG